ncbi:MAG: glycoside hydrolase [Sarcina sp.]
MKKKMIAVITSILVSAIAIGVSSFVFYKHKAQEGIKPQILTNQLEKTDNYNFSYTVNPETFEIKTDYNGQKEIASQPLQAMKVSDYKKTSNGESWVYPNKNIKVQLTKESDYLDVNITSLTKNANNFEFPNLEAPDYTLPMGEGKYIPANNELWKQYLNNYQNETLSMFSMPFFAINTKDYAITYIMTNAFNNNITFNTKNNIKFNIDHEFTSINPQKTTGYRIYVGPNSTTNIAKTYKNYIVNKGQFTTLQQKEKANPNIKKIIGAPQIYLWNNRVIEPDNINWQQLIKSFNPEVKAQIINILQKQGGDQDQIQALQQLGSQGFVDKYTKNLITNAITNACMSKDFYSPTIFKNTTPQIQALLNKGIVNLTQAQIINLNEMLLKEVMPNAFAPVADWANSATTDIINDMKVAGIPRVWIGLNDWTQAYMKPQMVTDAVNKGYLIAPYDSYTTIQKPGNIQWDTASFPDKNLYYTASMMNKDGKYRGGFKNQGRLLNPTLSMPSVKQRINTVLDNVPNFNSWFVDCDAAGDLFNDYNPAHITTKEQNLNARLKRLSYVANEKHMVLGSEGGDSYASQVIDFAQGLECHPFSWMDKSQMQNKQSPYYTGGYYSPTGGVPPKFGMQIPVKSVYKNALMNPEFTIPLYKLVYNNSVITAYHWLWGNFKVQGEVKNRFIHDILYNVPALYHLDASAWQKQKNVITENNKIYAPFSELVSKEEMTDFKVLTVDRLVQMTEYGNNVKVIANFSDNQVSEMGYTIKPQSVVIIEGDKAIYYTPPGFK